MEEKRGIGEYFKDVKITKEHNGYFCSVQEALTLVILGFFCGLRNVNQIHQWATNSRVSEFLSNHFGIRSIPCYYWLLCLLKLINPKSLNQCFTQWTQSFLPDGVKGLTLSFDGKTIRSTEKMKKYNSPLQIVSAHIAELGITFGQQTVDSESSEIPAVRELIALLKIEGCMVVADALHCQKETAKEIVGGKADYLLNAKDNQETLKQDIEDYVQDASLRQTMDTYESHEKSIDRIERRVAFSTCDIEWLYGKEKWAGLACIGAVNTRFTTEKGTTNEWHYYISSRKLTAKDLLKHARLEWSVESMHWLLDVHFAEDSCRVEDENLQQILNTIRKIPLNSIKQYTRKNNIKRPVSKIMFDCLLDSQKLLPLLMSVQN
jgi:predicted transposase YbfD/YdcC